MDTTTYVLIVAAVIIVILLALRSVSSGRSLTWTFSIPVGQKPKANSFNLDGPITEGTTGEAGMPAKPATQIPAQWSASFGSDLPTKESLGQRLFEQAFLPRNVLKDLEVQKLFEQGAASLQQQNYDQAVSILRQAVNLAHHNLYQPNAKPEVEGKIAAIAHANLANCLTVKGDLDAAIIEFREGLRLDEGLASLHDGLGEALLAKGDQDGAAGEFAQAARLDPNLALIHCRAGQALARAGNAQSAAREYRRALNLNPSLAEAGDGLRALPK